MKEETSWAAIPRPWRTSPTIVIDNDLEMLGLQFSFDPELRLIVMQQFIHPGLIIIYYRNDTQINKYTTYVSSGRNGAGPIKLNPAATKTVPTTVTTLGDLKRSHIHPNPGAVTA